MPNKSGGNNFYQHKDTILHENKDNLLYGNTPNRICFEWMKQKGVFGCHMMQPCF